MYTLTDILYVLNSYSWNIFALKPWNVERLQLIRSQRPQTSTLLGVVGVAAIAGVIGVAARRVVGVAAAAVVLLVVPVVLVRVVGLLQHGRDQLTQDGGSLSSTWRETRSACGESF